MDKKFKDLQMTEDQPLFSGKEYVHTLRSVYGAPPAGFPLSTHYPICNGISFVQTHFNGFQNLI